MEKEDSGRPAFDFGFPEWYGYPSSAGGRFRRPRTLRKSRDMNAFWRWWQQLPHHIDPVLFEIGGFRIHYYGLMYLVGFGITYALVLWRIRTEDRFAITPIQVESLMTAMILGVLLGGRLGYVLFYNFAYYLRHPLEIVLPFEFSDGIRFTGISGMSYHGGLLGVIAACVWFSRRSGIGFRQIVDLFGPVVPLGYTFGRIGNFINGELWGRPTDAAIGMDFPAAPGDAFRHPSQLYEAFFEGIFLFGVLWALRRRVRTPGAMLGLYLIGYGTVRFFIEYYREPDAHLGFVFLHLTMGQLLCAAMVLGGIAIYALYRRMPPRAAEANSEAPPDRKKAAESPESDSKPRSKSGRKSGRKSARRIPRGNAR